MKPVLFSLLFIGIVSIAIAQSPQKAPLKTNAPQNKATFSANPLDIPMVFVERGSFMMGKDTSDRLLRAHYVILNSFYIGKYEVTQAEWSAVMSENLSIHKNCPTCPVDNVNWQTVQVFIDKLNKLTGKKYRLPTEAEWEYAARGGNKSKGYLYSGSNNINEVAWYKDNSLDRSTILRINGLIALGWSRPVGEKKPNELGIYDMSGNAWEWCSDWYDGNYYEYSPYENPQGPFLNWTGDWTYKHGEMFRAIRGGAADSFAEVCNNIARGFKREAITDMVRSDNFLGFRLVLDQ